VSSQFDNKLTVNGSGLAAAKLTVHGDGVLRHDSASIFW
jgi:hypothetical protein